MRLRSVDVVSGIRAGLLRLEPRLQRGVSLCRRGATRLTGRLARIDIVPGLIAAADGIEAGSRRVLRSARHLWPRKGLGLTGALAWRGAAAISGIGLTAIFITGLSAKDEDRLALASLAAAAANLPAQDITAPRRSRPPATTEEWVAIAQPMAIFSLEAPDFRREPPLLEARRSPDDSRREDVLSFGSLAESRPHLLLRLATGEGAATGTRSFMVALVHEAARRGLAVERGSTPAPIETRFGPLETADVVLGDGKESRGCIAFRTQPGEAHFALSGWWCAAPKPSDRRQLVCLVERLDLVGTGAEPELRNIFARSELKRQPDCTPPRLSASGRKASWLDADGNLPALRMKTASAEPARIAAEPRKPRSKPVRR
ncbi:conserved hypothetical protein [Hyphomicrobiales bacterium]|nr:conserved hypothetical protein [Hyphomicrobiales bacterium]CAH1698980.1 conserved hypothetical protein [Hyphomicrobiales bacterium]CAI0342625.1 conserved hypothetical protein [Hyphomicrobiales bacterium]